VGRQFRFRVVKKIHADDHSSKLSSCPAVTPPLAENFCHCGVATLMSVP
jgi:hypothetical protein